MSSILGFIKSFIIWLLLIGFLTGAYLGSQIQSYTDYLVLRKDYKVLNTPEYKFKYRNNIWYKINRWASPEDFKDVLKLEREEKLKELDIR